MHSKAFLALDAAWTTAILGLVSGQNQQTEVSAVQVSCLEAFSCIVCN